MEREEKKRRLGSSSTSEQLRLLIMGLRLMAKPNNSSPHRR